MKIKYGIVAAVVAAMCALSGNAFADTAIANGSFESGPSLPSPYTAVPGGDSLSIDSWTTTQNGVEWFDPSSIGGGIGSAANGTYVIDLAYLTGGGIKQTVGTTPGKAYHLTFQASTSTYAGRDGTGQINVFIKDNTDATIDSKSFTAINNSSTVLVWQTFAFDFVATTAMTTIEFQNNQDQLLHFAFIDDVVENGTPITCNGKPTTLVGTNDRDVLYGTPGEDVILGLGGDDVIYGYDGNDSICAGDGDDTVRGGNDDDFISGGSGDDTLQGEDGNDTLNGDGGNDRLMGGYGNDTLNGGAGNDSLYGQYDDDDMSGGDGTDSCAGGTGNNTADNTCESTSGVPVVVQPTISRLDPTSGVVGASVAIIGEGLTGATAVYFNGTPQPTFTVISSNQISTTVPSGATTGPISVDTPNGTATSTGDFTVIPPTITNFTPTSGVVGDSVAIVGTGLAGATDVKFNGVSAAITLNTDSQVRATVPVGATTGPISVETPNGTATSTSDFTVTVIPPTIPTITRFTPTSGVVGDSVAIVGEGLTGATDVKFNGVSAAITLNTDTQVRATVPVGATTGPISVETPNGTATSTSDFTVIPPTITRFTPKKGKVGTSVAIVGTGLAGATDVKFNGVSAAITLNTDSQVRATVPVGATTGPISVETPNGTATSTSDFTVKP